MVTQRTFNTRLLIYLLIFPFFLIYLLPVYLLPVTYLPTSYLLI